MRTVQAEELQIAALVPLSTVDWPGRLVATIFLQGCPWSCHYCHNPDLISPRTAGQVPWREVEELADRRQGLLDGLVLTGGEPTRQDAVHDAARRIRAKGFALGLHTAGAYPRRLLDLLPQLDWVGLDLKATPGGYADVTGIASSGERAWRSLEILLASGVDHEVRTTVVPGEDAQAWQVAQRARDSGVRAYALQQVRSEGTRELHDAHPPGWDERFEALADQVAGLGFARLEIRRA